MSVILRFVHRNSNRTMGIVSAVTLPIFASLLVIGSSCAQAQSPSTSLAPRSLESLGSPTIAGQGYANSYHNASTATLEIGFTKYDKGFQMTSTACWSASGCARRINYSWKVPYGYKFLKGAVGYDLTNSCAGSTVRFLGNGGRALRFASTGGKSVVVMSVPASGAGQITLDLAGNSVLTIQLGLGFGAPMYPNGSCGGEINSAIDVVNDHLS